MLFNNAPGSSWKFIMEVEIEEMELHHGTFIRIFIRTSNKKWNLKWNF